MNIAYYQVRCYEKKLLQKVELGWIFVQNRTEFRYYYFKRNLCKIATISLAMVVNA